MRVEATRQAASTHPDLTGAFERERKDDEGSFAQESRALVVTETAAAAQTTPVYREAAFLAHLIATKGHAPQTRERRRAEPSEAIAAYQTVEALTRL
jgi:hypothetical protein